MENDNIGAYIIVGPSQSGKSSTINFIAQSDIARAGSGNGISVTSEAEVYEIGPNEYLEGMIMFTDLPGFFDSRLTITDEEILDTIKECLLRATEEHRILKGIILTESVQSDTNQILSSIHKLQQICGAEVKKSIIVLITKADYISLFNEKYQGIVSMCEQYRIPYVEWSNKIEEHEAKLQQMNRLKKAFSDITTFSSTWIDDIKEQIIQISNKLAAEQKAPSQEEIWERAKLIAGAAPEIEVQKLKKAKKEKEVTEKIIKEKKGNFLLKLFGIKQHKLKEETKKVEYEELVEYMEKQRPDWGIFVTVASEQLAPKPASYFIEEATKIKSRELRDSLIKRH
jgi:GTP-binding protein EngB required for normal cell division